MRTTDTDKRKNRQYRREIYGMTERKRLYRLRNDRVFCGVCSGIGEYLNVDANAVRIAAVLLAFTGAGVLAYIIAALLLPEK